MKTRLARDIGKRGAAALYRALVEDTLAWVASLSAAEKKACYTPRDASLEGLRGLLRERDRGKLRFAPQAGGDLGDRLEKAFDEAFAEGFASVVAVGTDCPLLGPRQLLRALRELEKSDLVLGPALDGGYYLVGLRRPAPEVFRGVPWSTNGVLEATLDKARRAGLSSAILAPLRDVDTREDLVILRSELARAWRRRRRGRFPIETFRWLAYAWPDGRRPARRAPREGA